ncbi:RcnB family protein [Rhodanobacter sp. Si-c]|uniref:RcnB family protein n=1 Tax=Rhodanobacter lycopersici TaxID=3162487 RepID=A0ABV3QIF4_9GAMM
MKTKLAMAVCAALLMTSVAMASQSDGHDNNGHHQSSSVMHDRGAHEGWYKKGGVMPNDYRNNRYVVSDWRSEHLREPPQGYHWVRSDNGDFLLVAVTTGVISSILLSH